MPWLRRARATHLRDSKGLAFAAVGIFALLAAVEVRQELVQDSWLTLVGGREVVQHGLAHTDSLFVWTKGRTWIDQQWLAQIAFYALYVVGGMRLLLLAHVLLLATTATIVVFTASRRGASPRAVLIAVFACLAIAPWALEMRAQAVAELLFAACLLLLLDGHALTRARAVALLALLALWANVHGSVVLGVGLVALRGVWLLRMEKAQRRLGLALIFLSPLCVLASPYAFSLLGYYRLMLANPLLPRFVSEWQATTLTIWTVIFFAVVVAGTILLTRFPGATTGYEKLVFALTALGALQAVRGMVWFALAAVPLLAPLLEQALSRTRAMTSRAAGQVGMLCAVAAPVAIALVFAHPQGWFTSHWPESGGRTVATLAARDPQARVLADDRYADWLLFTYPQLRGKIAYDIRFELFTKRQFELLASYRSPYGVADSSLTRGYRLQVFDPSLGEMCRPKRCRIVFRGPELAVGRVTP